MIYDDLYKTLIGEKRLRIMLSKVNGFFRDYSGTKYLVLLGPEKYDVIFNRIRYLIELKSGISYVVSHSYANIKIDSDDDSSLEKNMDFVLCYHTCSVSFE